MRGFVIMFIVKINSLVATLISVQQSNIDYSKSSKTIVLSLSSKNNPQNVTFVICFMIWPDLHRRESKEECGQPGEATKCLGDNEFVVVKDNIEFDEAKIECQGRAGFLRAITSQEEQNLVLELASEVLDDQPYIWIGESFISRGVCRIRGLVWKWTRVRYVKVFFRRS